MKLNKRGQFYIFTAVILIAFAFGSVLGAKTLTRESKTFNQLYANYLAEAPLAANNGKLLEYTKAFLDYSKTVDSNFRMAYIFSDGTNVSVYNALGKTININNQLSLNSNEVGHINLTGEIGLITGQGAYYFNMSNATELKALFISENNGNKRVYAKN